MGYSNCNQEGRVDDPDHELPRAGRPTRGQEGGEEDPKASIILYITK